MVSRCYDWTLATHTGLIYVMYEYEMKFSACLNKFLNDTPEELADCLHMYTKQAQ